MALCATQKDENARKSGSQARRLRHPEGMKSRPALPRLALVGLSGIQSTPAGWTYSNFGREFRDASDGFFGGRCGLTLWDGEMRLLRD